MKSVPYHTGDVPPELAAIAATCVGAPVPMVLAWGEPAVARANDAYRAAFGELDDAPHPSLRWIPVRDAGGAPIAQLGIGIERRDADARTLLDTVAAQIGTGVMVASVPSGRTIVANQRLRDILGDEGDAAGLFGGGAPYRDRELAIERADGSRRLISASATPVHDAGGAVVASVLTIDDVGDRRRALEAERAKDEFLAVLGHELRNPIAPIVSALDLMRLRGDHAHHRERAVIQRQIDHLLRLVEDLLDVSRVTRGAVALRRGRVDLGRVVALAIEEASPLIETRRHELVVDVADGLAVDGDETRLAQVVTNLLTNAAKYTDPRGHIEIAAARDGDEVALRVRDNGVGVRPELLGSIFDAFVQEAQTPERARGGLGLGLAIVKSLVELHGGSVEARSDGPGRGTEVHIRLPAARVSSQIAAIDDEASRPHAALDGVRVLIVDDNNDAADLLSDFLQAAGCRTAVAYDGPTALRAARSLGPSVALLDLGLPIMDGYEVARLLRALPGHGAIRLVAITGYGQASDRARTHAAGFDAHLVKPIAPDDVTRVIARLVTNAGRGRPRRGDPRTGPA